MTYCHNSLVYHQIHAANHLFDLYLKHQSINEGFFRALSGDVLKKLPVEWKLLLDYDLTTSMKYQTKKQQRDYHAERNKIKAKDLQHLTNLTRNNNPI